MEYRIQTTCDGIDWTLVRDTLKRVEMGYYEPDLHRRAFENSFAVVFVFSGQQMVAFGRALSDGAYQAAVYDVAVIPELQGKGVGRLVMTHLLERVAGCNVLLYSSPGKEGFYLRSGFAPMKTGMARFRDPEKMRSRGMI
jgi:GNAT superfamily N-acetyltransferase